MHPKLTYPVLATSVSHAALSCAAVLSCTLPSWSQSFESQSGPVKWPSHANKSNTIHVHEKPKDPLLTKPTIPVDLATTRKENEILLDKVDLFVRKNFYDPELVKTGWIPALKTNREEILRSKNLVELFKSMNKTMAALKSSHCEFATCNDEIFYFLRDLFGQFNPQLRVAIDYVGFVTGAPRFADNQVRYVLDGSPAETAGLEVGDEIKSVEGQPYVGQHNFAGQSGKPLTLEIMRQGKPMRLVIRPVEEDEYLQYVHAIKASARTFNVNGHTLGYIHNWCGGGGPGAHDAMEDALAHKLADTEGLILDLRDGYGGNSLSELDFFYRNPAGYPNFVSHGRDGKTHTDIMYFDKPIVAIINDGARSGKELLAFSLKRSGRAVLVGQNTAGFVLAGKYFDLGERAALYLAVFDCTIGGVRLEGKGVAPDIEVDDHCCQSGKNEQLKRATDKLLELVNKPRKTPDTPDTKSSGSETGFNQASDR